jgi:hypothetical protein
MTKENLRQYVGVPAAILATAVIVVALLSIAFVPRQSYSAEQRRQDSATDSLRQYQTSVTRDIADLKRIACLPLTDIQQRAVGCPR